MDVQEREAAALAWLESLTRAERVEVVARLAAGDAEFAAVLAGADQMEIRNRRKAPL